MSFSFGDRFVLGTERQQSPVGTAPYKTWPLPDGTIFTKLFRVGDYYLVRFPSLADFVYRPSEADITCYPVPGVERDTIEHLCLNQVLPLARSMEGHLVLHASGVEMSNRAALFVGASGQGKSTLATFCALRGARLISDDGVVFTRTPGDFSVEPGHRPIRLWPDSAEAVIGAVRHRAQTVQYSRKQRIHDTEGIEYCRAPSPVGGIFLLADDHTNELRIKPLNGREAFLGCFENLFVLDDRPAEVVREHFAKLAELSENVPHFQLTYPRCFKALPEVWDEIERHLVMG